MSEFVVDSCVWVDMIIKDRPRHAAAMDLGRKLAQDRVTVLVPMHAFFEIMTAASSESNKLGRPLGVGRFDEGFPLPQRYIPIDNAFLGEYVFNPVLTPDFLNVGAGDLIFLAIARKHQCPLVTEDAKFRARAAKIGIKAMDIAGYLSG